MWTQMPIMWILMPIEVQVYWMTFWILDRKEEHGCCHCGCSQGISPANTNPNISLWLICRYTSITLSEWNLIILACLHNSMVQSCRSCCCSAATEPPRSDKSGNAGHDNIGHCTQPTRSIKYTILYTIWHSALFTELRMTIPQLQRTPTFKPQNLQDWRLWCGMCSLDLSTMTSTYKWYGSTWRHVFPGE